LTGLNTRLADVIGGKSAKALQKAFGMTTLADLLSHYPRRYQKRGELTDMAELAEGEDVTVLAEIVSVQQRRMQRKRGSVTEAVLTDGSATMTITFFNQPWRERELRAGRRGLFAGTVSSYRGRRQLAHPTYQLFPDGIEEDVNVIEAFAGEIIPVYPATSSVTSWDIARAIPIALAAVEPIEDPVPVDVRARHDLVDVQAAIHDIHRPPDFAKLDDARTRLKFDEAFALQTLLAQRRAERAALTATARITGEGPLVTAFDARLPFVLTSAQQAAAATIREDLARTQPMHRLLQGDVGSGKTVVALRAMLSVVDAGGQAALLAPTEVLATQHYASITELLGPLVRDGLLSGSDVGTGVALLTGSQSAAVRKQQLLDIASGEAGIVIGTHALFQEKVHFFDLGLVVIDEQHRFGVEQRAALVAKAREGITPHVLIMTATPIPRSVAMTVFGDLDMTVIGELPTGRQPIATHVVEGESPFVRRAWERVREEVAQGHRVFVVAPRIGDSEEEDERASVLQVAERLRTGSCAGLQIGTLHGRMSPEEKSDVMRRFREQDGAAPIEVLVATTVIEVGIDVPTATMMVILDADRFGISQLHQLRGRVGRGGLPGLCLLFTDAPAGSPARQRLDAVAATTDGFALANADLELRREGDVLGAVQSGRRSSLRLLEVLQDAELIDTARQEANRIIAVDPELAEHPALRTAVDALLDDEQAAFMERG
jgi:ATP-dependent DNA helicase RecG